MLAILRRQQTTRPGLMLGLGKYREVLETSQTLKKTKKNIPYNETIPMIDTLVS